MTDRDLTDTLATIANRMQVITGLATELHRSVAADAQQIVVELEGAVDNVVRLLRDLQPPTKDE